MGMLGPMAGMAQQQFTQMVDQLQKAVREVHLTVSWKEGKQTESVDLVTHVVSLGPGSDRNGGPGNGTLGGSNGGGGFMRPDGTPARSPRQVPGGQGWADDDGTPLMPAAGGPGGGLPGAGAPGAFNPLAPGSPFGTARPLPVPQGNVFGTPVTK